MDYFLGPLVSSSKPAESKSSSRGGLTGFLQEKTGVTGAWMLGVGVSALLVSKELYIINSEVCGFYVELGVHYFKYSETSV